MLIKLPFGRERYVTGEVPDKNVLFLIDRGKASALKNPKEELKKIVRAPIGTSSLLEIVKKKR